MSTASSPARRSRPANSDASIFILYRIGLAVALFICVGQSRIMMVNLFDGHHGRALLISALVFGVAPAIAAWLAVRSKFNGQLRPMLVALAGLALSSYLAWITWAGLLGRWLDTQLLPLPDHLQGNYSLFVLLLVTPLLFLVGLRPVRNIATLSLGLLWAGLVPWLFA